MLLNKQTHQAQSDLAAFCRTGNTPDIKGVRLDNLPHYRRLVRNIFNDSLITAYPITQKLLSANEWEKLINDFMREYAPSNPQIWQMPCELWDYVSQNESPLTLKYPFLTELLWFEWLEVELYMMKDQNVRYKKKGNISTDNLVINPEHKIQHFEWPVFLKSPKEIGKEDKGHYFLVMFRDPDKGSVQFINVGPLFARLLEMLAERPTILSNLIIDLSLEMKTIISDDHRKNIEAFIASLTEKKLILGYQ